MIETILEFNKQFVENKQYDRFITDKFPNKKIAIVSCMDTRLTELLPAALGLKNGDAKLIKNAGGVISHPFGSVMRSLLIGVYELNINEIMVIGHTDCGARTTSAESILEKMKQRGVTQDQIDLMSYCGVEYSTWLGGFSNVDKAVAHSVDIIKKHPLLPKDILVFGFVIDSLTGELRTLKTD